MTKVAMVCPFSKGKCIECAIFRGRHYGLCFKTKYEARDDELIKTKGYAARKLDTRWEVPAEFILGGGCARNVEDGDIDRKTKPSEPRSTSGKGPAQR